MAIAEKKRKNTAVLNTSITAATKLKIKTLAATQGKKVWEVVEAALEENVQRKGSPDRSDKKAAIAQINCEIDASIKRSINILAAANDKRMRYEVEDALIAYLDKFPPVKL